MADNMRHYTDAARRWDGTLPYDYQHLPLAVLCQIRDELRTLNRTLGCPNVAKGFRALQKIAANDTAAFKRRVAAAARKREKRRGK